MKLREKERTTNGKHAKKEPQEARKNIALQQKLCLPANVSTLRMTARKRPEGDRRSATTPRNYQKEKQRRKLVFSKKTSCAKHS
jgi:hypothetical protein